MTSKKARQSGSRTATALIVPLLGGAVITTTPALALNECGAGPVVVCTPPVSPAVDEHTNGITYGTPVSVTVKSGYVINRTPGDENDGVQVRDASGVLLTVDLESGVIITTDGLHADGVEVTGRGDITINSAAAITVNSDTADYGGTSGIFGWINTLTGTGNIVINQLAGSTITATGEEVSGIYGLNLGTGSVYLSSSGTISTAGEWGYGINAWNRDANGADTTVTLNTSGSILTDGRYAVGLYSLNEGYGDTIVRSDGTVLTLQDEADGTLAYLNGTNMNGAASIILSDAATIATAGATAKGAWALNRGLGGASIVSAATVETTGINAHGLYANIRYDGTRALHSTADAWIDLLDNGSVQTNGASAHGLFVDNQGFGLATAMIASGSRVTTRGNLANGADVRSLGAALFEQAADAPVTVTGAQSFGVKVTGETLATADIKGIISTTGAFGVGAAAQATTGNARMEIAADATVTGGWQAGVVDFGATTLRPSAGILIGSGTSSELINNGIVSAGSDRAIADIGKYGGAAGNLTVQNTGKITGFVEMAGGGSNNFDNAGMFDVRHFADTNGDGVRDTKRVSISDFGANSSNFRNLAGATIRLASVEREGSVDASAYYLLTTGVDSQPLQADYYSLQRSGVVQGQFTNLGLFSNAGVIDLRGITTGNTLVMTGNATAGGAVGNGVFRSDSGRLLLNTVFNEGVPIGGQTGSFSDALIVDGTALGSGATTIAIDRRQGSGAATPGNGILLVEVRNKTASAFDVFVLDGDYIVDGKQAIVGGAFAYGLFHNGVLGDAADGNWYLRNIGHSPAAPVYETYPKVLQPLMDVATLQQRTGNRYWSDAVRHEPRTVFCKDPMQNFQCLVTEAQAQYYVDEASRIVETNGIWGRIEGTQGRFEPAQSTSGARYDNNIWAMQVGRDALLSESARGKLIGGLFAGYGRATADIASGGAAGDIDSNGYSMGGTLTWYDTGGLYVDAQAQATWIDSDLSSSTLERRLASSNDAFGYAVSLETGQRIELDTQWTLTPQVELTYTNVRFDSFIDPLASSVSLRKGASLRGRLGLATEYETRWKAENGTASRFKAYGLANLYNEFLDGTRVTVAGTDLISRDDRLWAGIGVGGSYNLGDDRYSIYGEVSTQTALAHLGDSVRVGGSIGFRVKW